MSFGFESTINILQNSPNGNLVNILLVCYCVQCPTLFLNQTIWLIDHSLSLFNFVNIINKDIVVELFLKHVDFMIHNPMSPSFHSAYQLKQIYF